ncbi:MAG: ArgE/DapE family deacylase [Candidatus Aminicenantes bacterium]|nr:MAG: ArgE/DapE family deacylase [Candidatus Aminicenantes bacterium]
MNKTILQTPGPIKNKISTGVDALKDNLIAFIQKLIQTPSLPGEEKKVQDIIASKLKELNFDVEIVPIQLDVLKDHQAFSHDRFPVDNRMNVIGLWKGTNSNKPTIPYNTTCRSLILNGHVDVVSPGDESKWENSPWSGTIKNERIYGRGSADMKAGLSCAIFACEALQKLGYCPGKDVIIQSVVGEETGGCGTLTNIIKGYTADAAIITEPTELKIYPIQSGALSFRIKINGKSMHACMKNKGVSAVEKFYVIFHAVNEFEWQRHLKYKNPIFEDPMNVAPINFGTVTSGDWPSTVPGTLVTEGRFGIFPDESAAQAKQAFEETVKIAAMKDEWLKNNLPEVEWIEGQFEPGTTNMQEPIIQTLSVCHEAVLDEKIKFAGATYGSDLRLFTNYAHIPAVLYGPGNVKDAHTVNESILIDEIIKAAKVLAFTIVNWC